MARTAKAKATKAANKNKKAAPSKIEEALYDSVPYESYSYPQTHPQRLYTMGTLFQMDPPDYKTARILEIGCAAGGNLIPVAVRYPESKCLGIDISGKQIEQANAHAANLELDNIEFRQMDIAKPDSELGDFDYIICHGVYSWVPAAVQDAILKFCSERLTPKGMAIISYNTLPGWTAIRGLRDMMLYHVKTFDDPNQKIQEAVKLLNFLYENTPAGNDAYRQTIDNERTLLRSANASYVFHDHLESENHQFYLHEFVAASKAHDLAYVGDTNLTTMFLGGHNKQVQDTLSKIQDIVHQEQYMDFLTNRRFRHSILTPAANSRNVNRNLQTSRIASFHLYPKFNQSEEIGANGLPLFTFGKPQPQGTFGAQTKPMWEIFSAMCQTPGPYRLSTLLNTLKEEKKIPDDSAVVNEAITNVARLVLQSVIEIYPDDQDCVTEPGEKPCIYKLARYQAALPDNKRIADMLGNTYVMHPFEKFLMPLVDGTRDFDDLTEAVVEAIETGRLKIQKKPLNGSAHDPYEIARNQLEITLKNWTLCNLYET